MRYFLLLLLLSAPVIAQQLPQTVKTIKDSSGVDTVESVIVDVDIRANRGGVPSSIVPALTVPILNAAGTDTGDTLSLMPTITIDRGQSGDLLGALSNAIVNEEEASQVIIPARSGARVFLEGYPPGSIFNETTRTLKMWPDFISSGVYTVTVTAIDGAETASDSFTITVNNNIDPPDPTVLSTGTGFNTLTYTIEIRTPVNSFLGDAGRAYQTMVVVPNPVVAPPEPLPLIISLHGGGGGGKQPEPDPDGTIRFVGTSNLGSSLRFGFRPPEEGDSTVGVRLHTGAQSDWPAAASGSSVFNESSQNRILLIIDWIRRTFTTPEFKAALDMNRISTEGTSMGGTGGNNLLTRYGYRLTKVDTKISGNAAKHHASAAFQNLLSAYWGNIDGSTVNNHGISAWEIYDLAGAVMNVNSNIFDRPWAKQVYIIGQNGITDASSSFKNWTQVASNTGTYMLDALQQAGSPHHVCWDNQGHGSGDSVLAAEGYSTFWCGDKASAGYDKLRLNKAYVAFSNSSIDWSPPLYNDTTQQFEGGDIRGGINRHLSWNNNSVVDLHDRFEIDLSVTTEAVDPEQNPAYPSPGEGWQGALPVIVDVTLRREQKFIGLPGETINWAFGSQSGQLTVASDGDIKVTGLQLTDVEQKLILTRVGW